MVRPELQRRLDASNVQYDTRNMSAGERFCVSCLLGAAIWNSIGMVPLIFMTFKKFWTFYHWTMIISTVGILICSCSQVISVAAPHINNMVVAILAVAGWPLMVTGQSLVLYSRLHLLYIKQKTLRLVLAMIVFNAIVIHVSGATLTIGLHSSHPGPFIIPYSIFERINIATFFIQETILSGLYLWKSRGLLGHYTKISDTRRMLGNSLPIVTSILTQLIILNVIVFILDVTTIALEYAGLYLIQLGYKVFVYSVKLQCEITILNRLLEFAQRTRRLNSDFQLTSAVHREWDTMTNTIEPAVALASERPAGETTDDQVRTDRDKR